MHRRSHMGIVATALILSIGSASFWSSKSWSTEPAVSELEERGTGISAGTPAALDSDVQEILQQIGRLKQESVGLDGTAFATSRAEARSALEALQVRLDRGSQGYAASWRRYLRLEEVAETLATAEPDIGLLRNVYERMRRNHPGLEYSAFTRFRSALDRFSKARSLQQLDDWNGYRTTLLNELEGLIQEESPTFVSRHRIGFIAGIFDSAGQAPELVHLIQHRFGESNIAFWISEDFIDALLRTEVDDTQPVSEVILGTQQRGTAHTTGIVTFDVRPSHDRARILATMTGETRTNNLGTRSIGLRNQLQIVSVGQTSVYAEKELSVNAEGFMTTPACADCRTSTQICCISSPPLISGLVNSQVYASKPKAEAIASRRAEARIAEQFDDRVREAIEANRIGRKDGLRDILTRLDARPQSTVVHSNEDTVLIDIRMAGDFQVASVTPPQLNRDEGDFGLALHDSAINNLFESVLAGKTMTRERLIELVGEQSEEARSDLIEGMGEEDWSIRFPSTNPIVIELREGAIELSLTGNRFTRANQPAITDPMRISVTYQPMVGADGIQLERTGELDVRFINRERLSSRQIAFQSFARDKFGLLFPETIESAGFELPEMLNVTSPVRLNSLQVAEGWIHLSWQRTTPE